MPLQETSITYNNYLYRYYYLYHYLPLTAGVDPLSRSLLKFKRGTQPDLDNWIQTTLREFHNIPLSPDTIIIRALRHDETQVHEPSLSSAPVPSSPPPSSPPPYSLDLLGQALATCFQCQYLPSLLVKSHPTTSNKGLTRDQRDLELINVYSINPEALPLSDAAPFLLIDDILTTGATIRSIIHVLQQSLPDNPLQIFTLAKVDHIPYP